MFLWSLDTISKVFKSYLAFVQKLLNYYFAFTGRSIALGQEHCIQDALKLQVKPFPEATVNHSSLPRS